MVTAVVQQFWIKPWQNGNLAALQSGSAVFTPSRGSTLVCLQSIWDTTRTSLAPTSSAGAFTLQGSNLPSGAGNGFQTQIGTLPFVDAVPTAVNPTVVFDGVGGQNGEQNLWIVELRGMPPGVFVRDTQAVVAANTSTTWSISTSNTSPHIPQVGDICLAIGMYENSAASVSAGLSNPPSGWTSIGVNQDATNNVPTQASYKVVSGSAAQQTITWTCTDAAKTYDSSVIVTLGTSLSTMTFSTQPTTQVVMQGGLASFTCAVTGATGTAHYQWYVNGVAVGQDSSTLIYAPGLNESSSKVLVVATDDLGAIYSSQVFLRVLRRL